MLWAARRPAMLVFAAFVAAACAGKVDTSWHSEQGYRWRSLAVTHRDHSGFKLLKSGATGITHANTVDDAHALANRNLLIGAGAAIADVDGDGLPDVFLTSVEQRAALYHNDGGMHFTDATAYQPGTTSRRGKPLSIGGGWPFIS